MTREEISELVEVLIMKYPPCPDERSSSIRYIGKIIDLETRVRHLEAANNQLAKHRRTDDLEIKTSCMIDSLRATIERQDKQIAKLKRELRDACENNHRRNIELDALHYVWCDGGCERGVHRYDCAKKRVTEEVVSLAERNTERLRRWYDIRCYRLKWKARGKAMRWLTG